MLRSQYGLLFALGVALLLSGCPDSGAPTSTDGTKGAADTGEATSVDEKADGQAEGAQTKVVIPERDSLAGNWMLVLSQQGDDKAFWIFGFQKTDKTTDAGEAIFDTKLVAKADDLGPSDLKSSKVEGDTASLDISIGDQVFQFIGKFRDGVVYGHALIGGRHCEPARLTATALDTLSTFREPVETPGKQDFMQVSQVPPEERHAAMQKFCDQHPHSPLAMPVYMQMLSSARAAGMKPEEIKQLAEKYFAAAKFWGERYEKYSRMSAGYLLSVTGADAELGLELLDAASKDIPAEAAKWQDQIDEGIRLARTNQALEQLNSESEDEQRKGLEFLQDSLKKSPFQPMLTFALGEYFEKHKQIDQALQQFAELSVLPGVEQRLMSQWQQMGMNQPLPSEIVARLWKEKHGNTDKLDEFLDDVYGKTIIAFAADDHPPAETEDATRVVLCELFTGAYCPPCVAADIATGGLEAVYPETDVVVLRYHQHIPMPDPLTNADSEARFSYYKGRGTPTVVISGGLPEANVGGYLQHSEEIYDSLRELVDKIAMKSSDIKIALKADAKDGVLDISADAINLPAEDTALRLTLALAEERVNFVAGNGIRVHDMVVRKMPGGPTGIPLKDGKLTYSEKIDLGKLKQGLADYLLAFEEGQGVEFPVKPLEMAKLQLVAFVQSERNHEVLQAAAIPVSGKLVYPSLKETVEKPKEADAKMTADGEQKPESAEKPKTETPKPAAEAKPADKPAAKPAAAPKAAEAAKPAPPAAKEMKEPAKAEKSDAKPEAPADKGAKQESAPKPADAKPAEDAAKPAPAAKEEKK